MEDNVYCCIAAYGVITYEQCRQVENADFCDRREVHHELLFRMYLFAAILSTFEDLKELVGQRKRRTDNRFVKVSSKDSPTWHANAKAMLANIT